MLPAEHAIARRLYRTMPGAPPVPRQDGGEMWAEVDLSPHYTFCLAIAQAMIEAAQAYSR